MRQPLQPLVLQPHFTGERTNPETEGKITQLVRGITDKRLNKKWKRVEEMLHPMLEVPTVVERTHKVWNTDFFARIESPEGLPRLPNGTLCPIGSRLIEVSYISRLSGGMGSYHQFDGYFVSLVLAPELASTLDARIEKAS